MAAGTYKLQLRQTPSGYMATARINVGTDFSIVARARVSAKAIEKILRTSWEGNVGASHQNEIGLFGFVKKLWRGAKKIAKKVARSKVLGKIAKFVRKPAFMAALSVIPGIGPIAASGLAAAGAAYGGLQAAYAKRRGKPRLARAISRRAARTARRYGVSSKRFNRAQRYGRRLAVNPRGLRFLTRGPPGGIAQLLRQCMAQGY